MINELLFVYGSLLSADNEFAVYLSHNSTLIGTGTIKGKLYDIGEYPGAIIDPYNQHEITGTIYQLHHPQKALKILDDYEGYGEDQDQPNLFVRELLPVKTVNGEMQCWVYLYNFPVKGLPQINSGNYLNKKGDE